MTDTTNPSGNARMAPRLFAVLPAEAMQHDPAACLRAFSSHADIASLLLPAETDSSASLQGLVTQAQSLGAAVLVRDSVERMRQLGADGLHVEGDNAQRLARLRHELGDEVIIGACCPTRRHAAMELGEEGADYLGIDQRTQARGENLLAWWAQMFTVPVVAMHPVAPEELLQLFRLGADFAVPVATMWQDVEQAAALGRAYDKCMRQITEDCTEGMNADQAQRS